MLSRTLRLPLASLQTRTFTTTPRLLSQASTRHENDPEVLEKGKQSVLRKHAKDSTEAPHWHEELASDSEAFVKSQREEVNASKEEIERLQKITKKVVDKAGTK